MAWQPLTRWEDISATLDTPLSDEAIRLLNERDRDLQRYLSTNSPQSCDIYETFAESDGEVTVAEVYLPTVTSGWLTLFFFGSIQQPTGTYLSLIHI